MADGGGTVNDVPLDRASQMHDTEIALLKDQVAGIRTAVADVGTKMDLLLDMHVRLSVLQERSDQAMSEIGRVRDGVNQDIGSVNTKVENLHTHTLNTRHKLDAWLNRGVGAAFVATLLLGVLQYVIIDRLNALQGLDTLARTNATHIDGLTRDVSATARDLARHIEAAAGIPAVPPKR